jgi:hypothetical protein
MGFSFLIECNYYFTSTAGVSAFTESTFTESTDTFVESVKSELVSLDVFFTQEDNDTIATIANNATIFFIIFFCFFIN